MLPSTLETLSQTYFQTTHFLCKFVIEAPDISGYDENFMGTNRFFTFIDTSEIYEPIYVANEHVKE